MLADNIQQLSWSINWRFGISWHYARGEMKQAYYFIPPSSQTLIYSYPSLTHTIKASNKYKYKNTKKDDMFNQ